MTKDEYNRIPFDSLKPNAIFHVGPFNVEVIQNPTSSNLRQMRKEFLDRYPGMSGDIPALRSTQDINGNKYFWKADEGLHYDIEPELRKIVGEKLGQNLERPLYNRVIYDAIKRGEDIPKNILDKFFKIYPDIAKQLNKKAQQKYLWDNDPYLSMANTPQSEDSFWETSGNFDEDIEECNNIRELDRVFNYHNIDFDDIILFDGEVIRVFGNGSDTRVVSLNFPNISVENAFEWIQNLGEYIINYIDYDLFKQSIINDIPGIVYHGTSQDNVEAILSNGLNPGNRTRGLSNRGIGNAVFTSSRIEPAEDYYDIVFEINVSDMINDNILPEIGLEEPIEELKMKQMLANKIGIDYYEDIEAGIDEDTFIFYGYIPKKYIRVVK